MACCLGVRMWLPLRQVPLTSGVSSGGEPQLADSTLEAELQRLDWVRIACRADAAVW